MLIDTAVLVDYLMSRADATLFLNAMRVAGSLQTSVVIAAEMLAGARDRRDLGVIDRL